MISDLQRAGLPGAAAGSEAALPARADSGATLGAAPSGLRFYVLPLAGALRPENLAVTGARLRGAAGAASGYVQAQAGPAGGLEDGAAVDVTVQSFGGAGGEVAVGVRSGGRELGRAFVPLGAGEGRALVPLSARPDGGGEAFLPEDALEIDNHRWFAAGAGRSRPRRRWSRAAAAESSPLALALDCGAGGRPRRRRAPRERRAHRRHAGRPRRAGARRRRRARRRTRWPRSSTTRAAAAGSAIILGPRAHAPFYGARLFPALGGLRVGDAPRSSGGGQLDAAPRGARSPGVRGLRRAAPATRSRRPRSARRGRSPRARRRACWPASRPTCRRSSRTGGCSSSPATSSGAWYDFPISRRVRAVVVAVADRARAGRRERRPAARPAFHRRRAGRRAGRGPALRRSVRSRDPARAVAGRRPPSPRVAAADAARALSPRRRRVARCASCAVDLDPRESDLARLSPAEARARWAGLRPIVLEGDADLARRIREGRYGRELAGLLLLLALPLSRRRIARSASA